jgi:DNA modification methylase
MTILHGDCVEVMAGMEPESVDAIVCDPPYGLEFMGKEWDNFRVDDTGTNRHRGERAGAKGDLQERDGATVFGRTRVALGGGERATTNRCVGCGKRDQFRNPHACPDGTAWRKEIIDPHAAPPASLAYSEWCREWALAAYRVAKPSAYLLAFGGTRTVHRMTVALEDAGWIIRDMLVWGYASGFPKSKASLKPAWEPIVMARKPGPLRMLAIDECRIPTSDNIAMHHGTGRGVAMQGNADESWPEPYSGSVTGVPPLGRWPANIILTATEDGRAIFDGGVEGVVGGGAVDGEMHNQRASSIFGTETGMERATVSVRDSGTYSRFFLIAKSSRSDREPVLGGLPLRDDLRGSGVMQYHCGKCGKQMVNVPGAACACDEPEVIRGVSQKPRANVHPTVKPTDLMRHLVRLVTPATVTVLQCVNGHEHLPPVRSDVPEADDSAVLLDGLSGAGGSSGEGLPELRRDVLEAGQDVGSDVLLAEVRERGRADSPDPVRRVRDIVPTRQAEQPLLFADLLGEGEREEATRPAAEPGGLHSGVEPAAPERREVGLRDAASSGDGRSDGPTADEGRGSRSHQRGEGRQPAREPASPDSPTAQQPTEAASEANRVPALPRDPAGVGACPTCGSPLAAKERRGHVLDPFGGSGTTALACEREGFDWTIIEREAEYVRIAEARLNGTQRGLGLESA